MSSPKEVSYKGKKDEFSVSVDDRNAFDEYTHGVSTRPLKGVVDDLNVHRKSTDDHDSKETASRSSLDEEFGESQSVEHDIIPKILKKGKVKYGKKD